MLFILAIALYKLVLSWGSTLWIKNDFISLWVAEVTSYTSYLTWGASSLFLVSGVKLSTIEIRVQRLIKHTRLLFHRFVILSYIFRIHFTLRLHEVLIFLTHLLAYSVI